MRSLRSLRERLPEQMPLAGLRIAAVGDEVVVRDGGTPWQADSGQLLFDFDAPAQPAGASSGTVTVVVYGDVTSDFSTALPWRNSTDATMEACCEPLPDRLDTHCSG